MQENNSLTNIYLFIVNNSNIRKGSEIAGSHPINLETLKLLTTEIINRCTKILVKWQLMKKDCDPK